MCGGSQDAGTHAEEFGAPNGALVVMDAGIASAAKPCPEPVEGIAWLIKRGHP
ncbi:MAG: hypothetical protein PHD43_07920 [Methylococcales bacterium]|nr:hypothetical protein [Methylococcales bacterium]